MHHRDKRIIKLRQEKMTYRAIATEVGVSRQTVADVLKAHGLNGPLVATSAPPIPRKELRQYDDRMLAEMYGCSLAAVRRERKRQNVRKLKNINMRQRHQYLARMLGLECDGTLAARVLNLLPLIEEEQARHIRLYLAGARDQKAYQRHQRHQAIESLREAMKRGNYEYATS